MHLWLFTHGAARVYSDQMKAYAVHCDIRTFKKFYSTVEGLICDKKTNKMTKAESKSVFLDKFNQITTNKLNRNQI